MDFANRESQLAFYHCMEKSGQDIRDFYEMLLERSRNGKIIQFFQILHSPSSFPGQEESQQGCLILLR